MPTSTYYAVLLTLVMVVGCGKKEALNENAPLKAENEKLKAEVEAARLKAENARLKAELANNGGTSTPVQTGETKTCYWCKESIKAAAQICKHCGSKRPDHMSERFPKSSDSIKRKITVVEREIRRRYYFPEGELTKANLEEVTKLDLSGGQVTELPEGLEKLTQLKTLYLGDNQLTNVKGLEKLTQLTGLSLKSNRLTNVKGLEKLTQLRWLFLHDNPLTNVTGLEKLTQLEQLILSDIPFSTKAQIDQLQKALPNCQIIQ